MSVRPCIPPLGHLIRDIRPGPSSSFPRELVAVGSRYVWFSANGPEGRELWKSDGTLLGTQVASDLNPGTASSSPSELTLANGTLYFAADDGLLGRELWKIDPGATADILGHGCGTKLRAPEMRASDPVLGKGMVVSGTRADPGALGFVLLGAPTKSPGKVLGCPTYFALTSAFLSIGSVVPSARGTWTQTVPIPKDNKLAGSRFVLQTAFITKDGRLEVTGGVALALGK